MQADKGVRCPFCRQIVESYSSTLPPAKSVKPQDDYLREERQSFQLLIGAGNAKGFPKEIVRYGRSGVVSIGGLNEYVPPPSVTGADGSGLRLNTRPDDLKEGYIVPPLKPYDDFVAMAYDRTGSRHLAYHLRPGNPRRSRVGKQALESLAPYAAKLSTHLSGNYVLQKLFDYASNARNEVVHGECGFTSIVRFLTRDKGLVTSSKDQRGTFTIQKMLVCLYGPQEMKLVMESIKGSILSMVMDQYAVYVIERIAEICICSLRPPMGMKARIPPSLAFTSLAQICAELGKDQGTSVYVGQHGLASLLLIESIRWSLPSRHAIAAALNMASGGNKLLKTRAGVRSMQGLLSLDLVEVAETMLGSMSGCFSDMACDTSPLQSGRLLRACLATPSLSSASRATIVDELLQAAAHVSYFAKSEQALEILCFGLSILPDDMLNVRVDRVSHLLSSQAFHHLLTTLEYMRKTYYTESTEPLVHSERAIQAPEVTTGIAVSLESEAFPKLSKPKPEIPSDQLAQQNFRMRSQNQVQVKQMMIVMAAVWSASLSLPLCFFWSVLMCVHVPSALHPWLFAPFARIHVDPTMYYPYRQDASVKEQSMLNTSTPAVLDSGNSSRQFASSFAAPQTQAANPGAFHHGGNLQSLHNVQATGYSIQSMQNALTRGTGMGGVPSVQAQPPSAGNMAAGRFGTSALPTNLQQQQQQIPGLHAHTGAVTNRGSGGEGKRDGSKGEGEQGEESRQGGQDQEQLGGRGEQREGDGAAFDMSEFPTLNTRPPGSGAMASGAGSAAAAVLRKGAPLNALLHQGGPEFSIQNEDFPALPGLKAGADNGGDKDNLTTLALGTDLTTLGLNLNSRENLYRTFASPWADGPTRAEPEFSLPACYIQPTPRLQPGYFSKFQQDTLFYIFYSMPHDEAQLFSADELCNRGWFYHKEHQVWFTRVPNSEPVVKTPTYERGSYYFFDPTVWETGRKDNFVLQYEMLEARPQLPIPPQR
ncbi:unnamed protein product [Closterium sp. Yama58-4]|nr:unnamed protein product [Closterium sp. Yama58-4]